MNECLLMVALIIALTWLILYCFYLKQSMNKKYEYLLTRINTVSQDRNHTDNSVYALARALGLKRCPTIGFVKENTDIK